MDPMPPASPMPSDASDPVQWVRRIVMVAIGIILLLGITTTVLGVVNFNADEARKRSDRIGACRAELRVQLVDFPNADVARLSSALVQIQAAGLESTTGSTGLSAVAPSESESSPYDGMTLEELRPLSAQARSDLHAAEQAKAEHLAIYRRVNELAKNDPTEFLSECERLTP